MMQPYSEYKNTEIDWLETIPKNWKLVKLKHVSSLNMGQSPSSDDVNQEGEGIPFIQGNAEFGALHPTPKNFCTEPSKICKPDDILISVRAPVGALNISDQKYVIGRGLSAITPESVRSGFCWYALQNSKYQLSVMETGTTFKAISGSDLANVFLPLPSQEEQRVIEGYLNFETSRIDRLITEKAGFIDLLKEKRQALISHVVTKGLDTDVEMKDSEVAWIGEIPSHWTSAKLKYGLAIKNGRDYKDVEAENVEGSYPVYGSGGEFRRATDFLYEGESVLFGRKGTVDKPLYVNGRFWTVDTMFYSEINPKCFPRFMYYVACTIPYSLYQTNTALPSMTQGDLLNNPIAYPDYQEQMLIADYLDREITRIERLMTEVTESINLCVNR